MAETDQIVVRADRRGVVTALLGAAMAWARGQPGMASEELTVWEFNDEARAFYGAHSFQTLVYRMGSRSEPALFSATPGRPPPPA